MKKIFSSFALILAIATTQALAYDSHENNQSDKETKLKERKNNKKVKSNSPKNLKQTDKPKDEDIILYLDREKGND